DASDSSFAMSILSCAGIVVPLSTVVSMTDGRPDLLRQGCAHLDVRHLRWVAEGREYSLPWKPPALRSASRFLWTSHDAATVHRLRLGDEIGGLSISVRLLPEGRRP